MKKLGILLMLVIGLISFSACAKEESKENGENKDTQTVSEEKAKDFQLKDLDGKIHKLSDYKGKKLLIEFWASWCHICEENLPNIDKLSADKNKGYEIVTVIAPNMSGELSLEEFKKWFKEQGYENITVLIDDNVNLMRSYGVRAFPTNVIIDSKQKVSSVIPGALPKNQVNKIFEDLN